MDVMLTTEILIDKDIDTQVAARCAAEIWFDFGMQGGGNKNTVMTEYVAKYDYDTVTTALKMLGTREEEDGKLLFPGMDKLIITYVKD